MIVDQYGRTFNTLRLSLTSVCNLACTYCVNDDHGNKKTVINSEFNTALSVDEIFQIVQRLHLILNFQTIRLTGGEPTLFRQLPVIIKKLNTLSLKVKMTTNGYLLKNLLLNLPNHALDSINISLDALDEDIFFQISKRRSLHKIIEAIDLAIQKGIHVKLNCVVIKGLNETQILPLLEYANSKNISIRFLELMKMGHLNDDNFSQFYSQDQILEAISAKYDIKKVKREISATANYWLTNSGHKFGIIANETEPFCSDCNRLRLDSSGNIYGCLSSNEPINVVEMSDCQLKNALSVALQQKQPAKFTGSTLSMLQIGG